MREEKTNNHLFRLMADLVLLISAINGWWFIFIPTGFAGAWKFSFFVEAVLAGFMYDALFGMMPMMGWLGYSGTLAMLAVMVAATVLKKIVRK